MTTAATWDRELIYNRSRTMGQEFYDLGKSSSWNVFASSHLANLNHAARFRCQCRSHSRYWWTYRCQPRDGPKL